MDKNLRLIKEKNTTILFGPNEDLRSVGELNLVRVVQDGMTNRMVKRSSTGEVDRQRGKLPLRM